MGEATPIKTSGLRYAALSRYSVLMLLGTRDTFPVPCALLVNGP